MGIGSLLEIVSGARELAAFARVEEGQRGDRRKARQVKEIIEALRYIYFSPRGVISLLEGIVDGNIPSEQQIEMILPRFNDAGPFVDRIHLRLDPPEGQPNDTLTLRAERVLREISWGKGGVREKVQSLLNNSLTFGEEVSAEQAAELLNEIRALNKAIEDAEDALVVAMR